MQYDVSSKMNGICIKYGQFANYRFLYYIDNQMIDKPALHWKYRIILKAGCGKIKKINNA